MMKQSKRLMIVRANEILKLSYSEPSQRQASGTNQRIKALRQGRHLAWGLCTHRHTIEAINRDWVYKQACRLSHDIQAISYSFSFQLII